jgi:hypothetical protein
VSAFQASGRELGEEESRTLAAPADSVGVWCSWVALALPLPLLGRFFELELASFTTSSLALLPTLVHEKHTQIVDHSRHDTIPMWVKFDEKFDRSNLMEE